MASFLKVGVNQVLEKNEKADGNWKVVIIHIAIRFKKNVQTYA